MTDIDVLQELAAVAANLGPALAPPAHDELLESIAETARPLFGAACSIALLELGDEEDRLIFQVAVGRGAEAAIGNSIPSSDVASRVMALPLGPSAASLSTPVPRWNCPSAGTAATRVAPPRRRSRGRP